MKRIIDHSWFLIIEFICICLAGVLWSRFPGLRWQPLIIAIAPLVLRMTAHRSLLVRTPFDIPIVIFLLTAAVGIWAAYQPAAAWTKFWLLLTSILFYYLLSRQSADNLWRVAIVLCLVGFGLSIYFFLSNNWDIQPQKFQGISQIGMAWMRVRPNITLESLDPNDIAGIAGITLPFSLALTLKFWRVKSYFQSILFGLMASVNLVAIVLSATRGAWVAVVAASGIYLLWWTITRWLPRRTRLFQRALFIATMGFLACLAAGYLWISIDQNLIKVALGTSDVLISEARFHIFWSAIELIKDVPFTGGGLDSFPGLYSSYIMIDPNFILGYSHNILLDAFLQQGILGGLMLIWVYSGSLLLLVLKNIPYPHSYLRLAVITSLLIIILYGLVDNTILRTTFSMLLFFVPGMAVGLITSTYPEPGRIWWGKSHARQLALPILITLGLMIVGLIIFRHPLKSSWYSDLGAVEMAKVELADFPTGSWDEGQSVNIFSKTKTLFLMALTYEPANPRAHYRLGLIAMTKRDFPTAIHHLEIAQRGDPYHRGMIKALGLSYLWNGEVDHARDLLSLIPETNQEIGVYTWWWSEQNRNDLAAYAEQYLELIEPDQ